MTADEIVSLRTALKNIRAAELSWKASDPPALDDIFTPVDHDGALDPARAIVVGNRGGGKSFWSGVLAHDESREKVGTLYPRLSLQSVSVVLGFHETSADGFDSGPAPSRSDLTALERAGYSAQDIWRGVLMQALYNAKLPIPGESAGHGLRSAVQWVSSQPADFEKQLRVADTFLQTQKRQFVLLFDALDRLGEGWAQIRRRTDGIMRLALQLRSSRALRTKIFMRSDQFADQKVFSFPDASKLRQESVLLSWRRRDLYGLLFQRLWNDEHASGSFRKLVTTATGIRSGSDTLPAALATDEERQAQVFYAIAGEFMGAGPTGGRTYSWLHDHLADAAGETSPRSFLFAIKNAAGESQDHDRVLSHKDLHVGVQNASQIRLSQLKEDYWWVEDAIGALEGLLVPANPGDFISRWAERKTAAAILLDSRKSNRLPPVLLADEPAEPEVRLLEELVHINVIERRTNGKINMPDIFRVAAKMKRRGGLRPPALPGQH